MVEVLNKIEQVPFMLLFNIFFPYIIYLQRGQPYTIILMRMMVENLPDSCTVRADYPKCLLFIADAMNARCMYFLDFISR